MSSLVPVLAAGATAIGIGGAVGLLFGVRPRPLVADPSTAAGGDVPAAPAGPSPRFVDAARRALPTGYLRMLDHRIALAGRPASWTLGRLLVLKPLLAGVVALLALWFVSGDISPFRILLGLVAVLIAFFVPDLLVYSRGVERQQVIEMELPDTLDQMTISVEAGLGFEAAMAKAATNGTGPLAEELIRTLQDMSMGQSRRAAYETLASRTSSADLRRFTKAVIQADVYGVPVADVLRVQASEMRMKRRQRAEEKAMKVPVKVLFPLLFCILPVLFIVLLAPAALHALQAFGAGR